MDLNERIDEVNDRLKLIQYTDGLTFGTDALLLAGYIKGKYERAMEIGSGSGIISMLVLTRDKAKHALAVEVQEKYAELTRKNAELNSLSDRLSVECADVRDLKISGEFDLVFTNPPYMKTSSGFANEKDGKNIARHEIFGTIDELCQSASRTLKFGGTFIAVYRPDRLTDLICAMRMAKLEPKRVTFVHARCDMKPSMVLVEAKMGGKSGAILTKPLIIYGEGNEYTPDMNFIMENGIFPADFYK